jgi:hypothetical protein
MRLQPFDVAQRRPWAHPHAQGATAARIRVQAAAGISNPDVILIRMSFIRVRVSPVGACAQLR